MFRRQKRRTVRHPVRTVSTSICRRARRTLMQDEVSSADSVTNGRPIHNRNPEAGNPRQCWLWLGERSRAQQRKTAAERREVLRNGVVWRCSAHEATGRNRANTGAQGKKIPTDKGWDFGFWWWKANEKEAHHVRVLRDPRRRAATRHADRCRPTRRSEPSTHRATCTHAGRRGTQAIYAS